MTPIAETEVVEACQTLFGKHIDISRDFLHYMQPSGVKSAYRKKAKENHPDLFAADPPHVQKKQTELFREILRAYDVLNLFFEQRDVVAWKPRAEPDRQRDSGRPAQTPRSSPQPVSERKSDETFFSGSVPPRTLQIGQYLYYRGKVSFGSLINALVWQRGQRPSFGDIALRWGLLDREDVDRISRSCERPRLFGEKAVELGLLTVFQVNTILLFQRSQQGRLGNYFVQNKVLLQEELDRLVRELNEHNAAVLASSMRTNRDGNVHA
jgi:DnaJ-like protein